MLHDLANEIQKYKRFYKIKVARSLAHVKGERRKKGKQKLIAKFEAKYEAKKRWLGEHIDRSSCSRQFHA